MSFALRADKVGLGERVEQLKAVGAEFSPAPPVNRLSATVAAVEYQGALVQIRLHAEGCDEFAVSLGESRFFAHPVAIGDRVEATWTVDDVHPLG